MFTPQLPDRSQDIGERGAVLLLLALTALGLGLRLFRLGFQSFWLDEAVSAHFVGLSYADIWRASFSTEANPPLYFWLLKGWAGLWGTSEGALRSLSVLGGAALIPITYALGASLGHRRWGLLAALVVAVNPFLVWLSQEARVFALVGTAGAGGVWLLIRACEEGRARWWLGFALCTLIGLSLHFYAAFLSPFELLYVLLFSRRRSLGPFVLATSAPVLFFVAWAVNVAAVVQEGNWRPFYPLPQLLLASFEAFTTGQLLPSAEGYRWLSLLGMLAVVGLLPEGGDWRRKAGWRVGVLLALYLFTPVLLSFLFSLRTPIFVPKYLVVAAPASYLLVARGLSRLWCWRWPVGLLSVVMVLVPAGLALQRAYITVIKEDYRAAADYLKQYASADGKVFLAESTRFGFAYYGVDGATPLAYVGSEAEVEQALTPLLAGHDRLWLALSHEQFADPQGLTVKWLAGRYPKVTELYPVGVQLHGFLLNYRPRQLAPSVPRLDVSFGDAVRLVGYEVANPVVSARDVRYHPPSNWLHLTLYWQATREVVEALRPSVRLVDEQGQVWGDKLERPGDVLKLYPTSQWRPGELVRDEHDINLNPVTPEGRYRLEIALFSGDRRLLARAGGREVGDRVGFGEILVRAERTPLP